MRRVCLTLPTHRPASATIAAVAAEAAYGAREFGVEVHLLILDSALPADLAGHRRAVAALPPEPGVVVHHLDESEQRAFLRRTAVRAGVPDPGRVTALMLPSRVSYGACTNRAFLVAEALGCDSVHRRDSDSRYQLLDGAPVFPLHHELTTLGRPAADLTRLVTRTRLDPAHTHRPVVVAGGSFIGEMSVDVDEIQRLDPAVHRDLVGLSLPEDVPRLWRQKLVDEAFRGAGTTPFAVDHTTLTRVSPARVDMCNVAFDRAVHARVPLPPATDTLGTDYFLLHLLHAARLPGVLHNRHIVNHHTAGRRTDAGLLAYQLRLARFLLAAPYHHAVHAAAATAGDTLLDPEGRLRADAVAALVRDGAAAPPDGLAERFDVIHRSYRTLGGRYAAVAAALHADRARLLDEPRTSMADFAVLIDAWPALTSAARSTGLHGDGASDGPGPGPGPDSGSDSGPDSGSGRSAQTLPHTPDAVRPPEPRTITVPYAQADADGDPDAPLGTRRGPVTMGQANMIRCILREDPLHINNHDVWPVPAAATLTSVIDAFRTLVLRHEALRTTFPDPGSGSEPRTQVVVSAGEFTVTVLDHDTLPPHPAAHAETLARAARAGRFRLDRDFPLRLTVLTERGAPAFVALSASHAATDGTALAVLREEWLALLAGGGLPPVQALTPLDLAAEEASPAGIRRSESSLRYWSRIIGTRPQEMFAEPRAARTDGRHPQLTLRSARGARALAAVARRTGSPSATVLLTTWCTLVAHRAGQSTCVVAAPLSNRSRPGLARAVNTLSQDALLALDVRGPTLDAVLRKAWGAALDAYRHSQFDAERLWDAIDRVTAERGSRFARDVVFNDVSGIAEDDRPATSTAPDGVRSAADAAPPELALEWGPVQVLPTRLLCFAYRTTPLLHLGMWADPALFTRPEAETFLTGLVRLLEAAAHDDVPLSSLTEVTGVLAAERDANWALVDGCWVSPDAIADALGTALGGLPVHVTTGGSEAAADTLTAYLATGGAPLTPADAHRALTAVLSAGTGPSGLLAPRRYVIVRNPPPAADDTTRAWADQRVLMEGDGRQADAR